MIPTASVCMVTYQHAAFIKNAIEGALAQRTEFPTEIVIGEDGSADGTREICLGYARTHPARVRVSLRDRSEITSGDRQDYIVRNFLTTLRESRGEFIALCEGDDYWTDPSKLQRQVDYLRANQDCVGCFHDTQLVDATGQILLQSYFQSDQDKFTQHDVLDTLLSREPTCSLVFRRSAIADPLPEWFLRHPSDLFLDVLLTNHGSLGFVRRNMGAYRKHVGGIWSGQREAHRIIELIFRYRQLLADPVFSGKYGELLLRKIGEFQSALFTRKDAADEIERLERVVQEQTQAVTSMQTECDRLTAESMDAQKHIDELLAQFRKLTSTSHQQDTYIAILEKERDRLTALTATQAKESEHYVNTINEQTAYIKILEVQRALTDRR